jgi:hypothetical protein
VYRVPGRLVDPIMRGCIWLALMVSAAGAWAAPLPDDARLQAVRAELQTIVDRAARDGLPDALLADKIREGLAKGVPAPRIVGVVRTLATELQQARSEAAPHVAGVPSQALLKAIVDAHALGVRAEVAELLAATRGLESQTRAVEVLGDLAQRGYPAPNAEHALAAIARHPAELDHLPARVESLTARGATRAQALDALARSSTLGLGLDGASQFLNRGLGDDGRGPNRETSGPRGPNPDNNGRRGKQ